MKPNLLTDYLGYIAVRTAGFFFRLFPVSLELWLARRLGSLIYYLNIKRRRIAYRNLKAALGPELEPAAIKKVVKEMYRNLAQMLVEVLTLPRVNKEYIEKFVIIEGIENLAEAKKAGKGVILLTGHFGNWELSSIAGGISGYPMTVLAREQRHSRLNEILNRYREITGSRVIRKGFAVKEILATLRKNAIVGMVADQDAGRNGVFVDFFGRKTSFAPGPVSLALRTGATIIPAFIIREKGPRHRAIVNKPIKVEDTGDEGRDIRKGLQEFAILLESYIRREPAQWLWLHKRWKSTPTRKILILSDGKAGHLNQSIAVAEIIERYRQSKGYQAEDTTYRIIDIRFKNGILKNLFSVGAAFIGGCCQGCMRCSKACLERNSYGTLAKEYADIVISCGSSLERLNILMSKELGAKGIAIMKPSTASARNFDLVIAPRHDNLKEGRNIVITEGSPTRITEEKLKKDSAALAGKIKFEKEAKIGVLIGGDNPEFRLTESILHELIDAVIEIACQIDAEILVTTSRRTPAWAEGILKKRLGNHMRCRLLVIANEKNMEEAVGGILGLSRIVIVSSESVSMISEALNAGNYTFVFELEKKAKGLSKHELFLSNLAQDGYIELVKAPDLVEKVKEIWARKPSYRKLDDETKIAEAIERVI